MFGTKTLIASALAGGLAFAVRPAHAATVVRVREATMEPLGETLLSGKSSTQ
jgi:hypothetical protein